MSFRQLASAPSGCDTGGFNSSAVLVDADEDGQLDALGTDFCGTTTMLSGTGEVLWTAQEEAIYGTANPALADVDADGTPEAIVAFGSRYLEPTESEEPVGTSVGAYRVLDGERVWSHSIDRLAYASPTAFDASGDGLPDIGLLTARGGPGLPESDPDYSEDAGFVILSGSDGEELRRIPAGDAAGTPMLFPLGSDTGLIVSDTRPDDGNPSILALRLRGMRLIPGASWVGFRPGAGHEASWTPTE